MFLFFDVESNGKPRKWNAPASDTFNWPRMVQIAWQFYDNTGVLLEAEDYIIKPEGFEISGESEHIHKISTEIAREEGTDLAMVLKRFSEVIRKAKYVVAHNLKFDGNVVGAELARKEINHTLFYSERFSLMEEATYFCKLPGPGGRYKWPTLNEVHAKLFETRYADANNAKVDVQACANCFFKLVEMEEIDLF